MGSRKLPVFSSTLCHTNHSVYFSPPRLTSTRLPTIQLHYALIVAVSRVIRSRLPSQPTTFPKSETGAGYLNLASGSQHSSFVRLKLKSRQLRRTRSRQEGRGCVRPPLSSSGCFTFFDPRHPPTTVSPPFRSVHESQSQPRP